MKDEIKYKITSELNSIFPKLLFTIWEKNDIGKIFVDSEGIPTKAVIKFNPELLEQQFNTDNSNFFKDTIKIFAEIIDKKYVKRLSKFRNRFRGKSFVITKSQLDYAFANSKSCNGAARVLGVDLRTLKKYVELNDMLDTYNNHKNFSGKGVPRGGHNRRIQLVDIIYNNKHPNYDTQKLKHRLISECILEEQCNRCGYNEKRYYDQMSPLILDYIDGNKKNKHIDNLQLLCYNCTFLVRPLNGRMSNKLITGLNKLDKPTQLNDEIDYSKFEKFNTVNTDVSTSKNDIFDIFNKF